MAGAYHLESLRQADKDIEDSYGFWGTGALLSGIDKALAVPELSDLYGLATATADRVYEQAVALDQASVKVARLSLHQLPAAIDAAQTRGSAEDAMFILCGVLSGVAVRLEKAAYELTMFGRAMEDLATRDRSGMERLGEARARLDKIDGLFEYDSGEMGSLHEEACYGVSMRLDAHDRARGRAEQMTDLLNGLPDRPVVTQL